MPHFKFVIPRAIL